MSCWKVSMEEATILPTASRGEYGAGEERERADDHRPVAPAQVGREAFVTLRGDVEPSFREAGQAREHAPVAVDGGGDARVGRGEVHAAGLQRAQPRDLQVLARRE